MRSTASLVALVLALGAGACGSDHGIADPGSPSPSRSFGIWSPEGRETCTKEQHDAYAVVGPDGRLYPTWHPPIGPGGCSFGHEHGRDPRGSNLFKDIGPVPFGYANEMLAISDPANVRDEDHFGHKVEWENDIYLRLADGEREIGKVRCDVLVKLHQGTHSRDAFANNLHELVYHLHCDDGSAVDITLLTAIGQPGHFVRACDRVISVDAGPPTPANSPVGDGVRLIPDRSCIEQYMLRPPGQPSSFDQALHETWQTSSTIRREDGEPLAFFNPYFQVLLPSRYHDPARAPAVGRSIDVCYEETPEGHRATGGACAESTGGGLDAGVTYDDPRSRFNGAARFVDINVTRIRNLRGPPLWYTDAFGQRGAVAPFRGSIRQRMGQVDRDLGLPVGGPRLGEDRDYGGSEVRSPN
jgi:hypothetical protein